MTQENILTWLKTLSVKANHYYSGILDGKKEKSIGVYQLKSSRARAISLGGAETTKTGEKTVSLLIHWNNSTRETENFAKRLYDELSSAKPVIGGKKVNYIKLINNEPIDVGVDENGICERVIELIFYYERNQ